MEGKRHFYLQQPSNPRRARATPRERRGPDGSSIQRGAEGRSISQSRARGSPVGCPQAQPGHRTPHTDRRGHTHRTVTHTRAHTHTHRRGSTATGAVVGSREYTVQSRALSVTTSRAGHEARQTTSSRHTRRERVLQSEVPWLAASLHPLRTTRIQPRPTARTALDCDHSH